MILSIRLGSNSWGFPLELTDSLYSPYKLGEVWTLWFKGDFERTSQENDLVKLFLLKLLLVFRKILLFTDASTQKVLQSLKAFLDVIWDEII